MDLPFQLKVKLIVTVLIIIMLTLSSCSSNKLQIKATQPAQAGVTIGFIGPLSGDLSKLGQEIKQGVEVFAKSHPDVKVIYEDDKWDPKNSLTSYRKLRDIDGVKAFIGPLGPAGTMTIEGAMSEEDRNNSFVAAITLCTDEFRNYSNVICSYPSMAQQAEQEVGFAASIRKRTGYLITEQSALGQLVESYFKQAAAHHNQTIVGIDKVDLKTDKVFYTYATKIMSANPEVVYVVIPDIQVSMSMVKILKEQKPDATIIFGMDLEENYANQFKDILDGVYAGGQVKDDYDKDFSARIMEGYNITPNLYHALGYEVSAALYESIKAGGMDKGGFIGQVNNHNKAIRGIRFQDSMVHIPLQMKIVHDGKIVLVSQ